MSYSRLSGIALVILMMFLITASSVDYAQAFQGVEIALLPHKGVYSVRWSPNGLLLATVSWDKINIWDTSTWTHVASINEPHVNVLVWSPHSDFVAGTHGGDSERVLIWAAETGNLVGELSRPRPFDAEGTAFSPQSIAWHPDGQIITTDATLGLKDEILLWNANLINIIQEPQRLNVAGDVRHNASELMWSQNGDMLLTSGADDLEPVIGEPLYFTRPMSYVIDVAENETLIIIPERAIVWGPNDTRVISAIFTESSYRLTIWELSSGSAQVNFDKHTSNIYAAAWNYFMPVIASADIEGHIYFWNPDTGITYEIMKTDSSIRDLSWKANSGTLALAVEGKVIIRTYDLDI